MLCGPGEFSECCDTANTCLGGLRLAASAAPHCPVLPSWVHVPGAPMPAGSSVCNAQTQSLGPIGWGWQHIGVESARDGFSGHNYRLEMVDCIFCVLLLPRGKRSLSLACDNRATTWGDGGGSRERTGLRGACTFGTVLGVRKSVGFGSRAVTPSPHHPQGTGFICFGKNKSHWRIQGFGPFSVPRVGSE